MTESNRSSLYGGISVSRGTASAERDEITDTDPSAIAHQLFARTIKDRLFTRIGSRTIVALRPVRGSPYETLSKEYAARATTPADPSSKNRSVLPPHAFSIAQSAYLHATRTSMDQSIILLGESATGKSEIYRMLVRHFCDISKIQSKKTKAHSMIVKASSILAAFGNATTPYNPDATCFTQYTEIQFNQKGKMVGAKLIEYLLEKTRVNNPLDGGRTFHIFYYMLEGANNEERSLLNLYDAAHFNYLAGSDIVGFAQGNDRYFDILRGDLKSLGIGRRQQSQIWQILAAILHLGNVQFRDPLPGLESCAVKNPDQLQLVADMLGLDASSLLTAITSRTRAVGRDNVFEMLDASEASIQRNSLARALYTTCFSWIVEQINKKLCAAETEYSNFVSILEVPGFAGSGRGNASNDFNRLLVNFGNERLYAHVMTEMFESPREVFLAQGIPFPDTKYASNKTIISILDNGKSGLFPLIDRESASRGGDEKTVAKIYETFLDSGILVSANSKKISKSFGIHHFAGIVQYDTTNLGDINRDILQSGFISLIRGDPEHPGTSNQFVRSIFSDKIIAVRKSGDRGLISGTPKGRFPSLRRKASKNDDLEGESILGSALTVGGMYRAEINTVLESLSSTQPWFIHCINPIMSGKPNIDAISRQVKSYDLGSLIGNPAILYTSTLQFGDFVERYKSILNIYERDTQRACESYIRNQNWKAADAVTGNTAIFLAERHWMDLEVRLMEKEVELNAISKAVIAKAPQSLSDPVSPSHYGSPTSNYAESIDGSELSDDSASHYESEFGTSVFNEAPIRASDLENGRLPKSRLGATIVVAKTPKPPHTKARTQLRRNWLCFTWSTTFCFPSFCLSWCGGMKDRDRQLAWREKFALCVIIFFMNLFVLFIIIGIGFLLCPPSSDFSPGQLSSFISGPKASIYMYGSYYQISGVIQDHLKLMDDYTNSNEYWAASVLGRDVTYMFPRQKYASSQCNNIPGTFRLREDQGPRDPWWPHNENSWITTQSYKKGRVVADMEYVNQQVKQNDDALYIVIYDKIYDFSPFYTASLNPNTANLWFVGEQVKIIADGFRTANIQLGDASEKMRAFARNVSAPGQHAAAMRCLDALFLIGNVDHRNDLICVVPNYILLAFSIILVSVIGFKFLAALQFPGKLVPEGHDKFVICQVPCYTEGEASLHRTIDSLTNLKYDDKHKLLFIVCDGMIIGAGNDRPTPRIVLDILGVDPTLDTESFAYHALGDGNDELNMGKVYSGLYEFSGHCVPYIVVVKVGKPIERKKPGNRGKRDSQLVLMKFLSKVHFNQAMSPLELEIFHHMKDVIGVDPSFYEYVFMVDADTQVHEDSLNHLVSHMIRDSKVSGTCGETSISNDRKSFTSMIQVYEYFISHHMAKAFESLFGSVTCLPGCFCMYRIRTPKNVPVLIAPGLIADYSENTVDTLHLKNLLHLGEDRYLTTLTMKHFPNMRTTFVAQAKCQTTAPDQWPILLSQRRRWINSTIHNLFELLRLNELCGFCCLSLRFVVFIDLIATFIQPSSLIYVGYLVYLASTNTLTNIPVISLVLIAAVYGFQVVIFLLKTQWQHVGWMIFYLMAIPAFGLYIPIYSFWHFDDFSWGNTRLAVGEDTSHKNDKLGKFDPASVPLKKWSDYEQKENSSDGKSKASYPRSSSASLYNESVHGDTTAVGLAAVGHFPSDEELLQEIRHILSTTDLMKITKKSVRDRLSRLFGVDLSSKKQFIHDSIDAILKGE